MLFVLLQITVDNLIENSCCHILSQRESLYWPYKKKINLTEIRRRYSILLSHGARMSAGITFYTYKTSQVFASYELEFDK